MNKIEIVTQPNEPELPTDALYKLEKLVEESEAPPQSPAETLKPKSPPKSKPRSPNPTVNDQDLKKKTAIATKSRKTLDSAVSSQDSTMEKLTSSESESEEGVIYDDDGFAIPEGKIPLDGHFSTGEIKQLVDIAQQEGLLRDDIKVKVVETNEVFGDKIEVVEKPEEPSESAEQSEEGNPKR